MVTKSRVKLKHRRLGFFVEKNFDARALLAGIYDFGTCVRPNGTFYGHGGEQCRQGVQAVLPDRGNRSGTVSPEAVKIAEGLTEAQLKAFGKTRESLQSDLTVVDAETTRQVKRLQAGEVSKEEIDRMMIEHMDYDIGQSQFVFIGMENGLGGEEAAYNGSDSSGQRAIASNLAVQNLVDSGQMSASQVAAAMHANETSKLNQEINPAKKSHPNSYIGNSASLATQAAGASQTELTNDQALAIYFNGKSMATIEMSVPAAKTVSDGSLSQSGGITVNSKGINSADPNRSMYGALINGQAGPQFTGYSRQMVKKEFETKRAEFIGKELQRAATNPDFQGGFGAPGSSGKGGRGGKYQTFRESVIDPLARSGTPVYTTTVKLSTGTSKKDGISDRTVIKGGVQTKEHTLHIAELAPGKFFVSADLSMNTNGYSANNNHFLAYSAGLKAVENGAPRYTPPTPRGTARRSVPRTPAPSAPKARTSSTPTPKATAPVRTGTSQKKIDLRRDIQKARRDGRDGDVQKLEKTLKKLK